MKKKFCYTSLYMFFGLFSFCKILDNFTYLGLKQFLKWNQLRCLRGNCSLAELLPIHSSGGSNPVSTPQVSRQRCARVTTDTEATFYTGSVLSAYFKAKEQPNDDFTRNFISPSSCYRLWYIVRTGAGNPWKCLNFNVVFSRSESVWI